MYPCSPCLPLAKRMHLPSMPRGLEQVECPCSCGGGSLVQERGWGHAGTRSTKLILRAPKRVVKQLRFFKIYICIFLKYLSK